MSERRRLLEIIASQGKWLPYSFEYLYHSLIPQTISGKNVKNKAKAVKFYGNSEVENQLCDTGRYYGSELTFNWLGNGKFKVSGTTTQTNTIYFGSQSFPIGTTLLVIVSKIGSNSTFQYRGGGWSSYQTAIKTTTTTTNGFYVAIDFYANNTFNDDEFEINLISLTQRYPFDTPTTLTDNRVQNIINRGYIPFNSGEIKNVDISELMSEPYNLFDEVLESGYIDANGVNQSNVNRVRSKNFIKVVGGQQYTLEEVSTFTFQDNYSILFVEYDKNKNFISRKSGTYINNRLSSITLSNETCYVRFYIIYSTDVHSSISNIQVCFHRTGTRTGYAPHTAPQTIPFKYQGAGVGTSHDAITIYNDRVEFVKEFLNYQFTGLPAVEDWQWYGADNLNFWYFTPVLNQKAGTNNLCSNGIKVRFAGAGGSVLRVLQSENPQINSSTDMNTLFNSSVSMLYQKNNPQVITIPRKHLGIKRIRDLSWTYNSQYNIVETIASDLDMNIPLGSVVASVYCECAITIASDDRATATGKRVYIYDYGSKLTFRDMGVSSANDFIDKYGDYYIFYETENEVADIFDTIGIEAGGTMTSNWFSWVENQLNDNPQISPSGTTNNDVLFTKDSNGTLTMNGTASGTINQNLLTAIGVQGHFYLILGAYGGSNSTYWLRNDNRTSSQYCDYGNGSIVEWTPSYKWSLQIHIESGTQLNNVKIYPQVIDLTIGFGAGNEPTSINDPRIQEILRLGYIPTNTTGTLKHIDPIVLPNADMKLKSK